MKQLIVLFLLASLTACGNDSQQSDNEKESKASVEIKTDSGEVKINENGISVEGKGSDSVNIKINANDGIKVEGKDGAVEIKSDEGDKIKLEKKGKEVNIQIKEN